ncbi:WD40-repeat-containing domain protein [Jimgerdemannia flammicorona]|uniref:WD40-repeat-containing domain protein n=1 Tax=Jimgerdemannia flammicorona TaxID=994334 RepID=A0A433QP21_9FUNG|nr:WD40-repeat-containing domain protein [Jimgerdemannia flammicorona]
MSDPFFVTAIRKRKKPSTSSDKKSPAKRSRQRDGPATNGRKGDDNSSSEDDLGPGAIAEMDLRSSEGEDEEDEISETAAEKRVRLAKKYLEKIKSDIEVDGFDAADIDRDLIAERLRKDANPAGYIVYIYILLSHRPHPAVFLQLHFPVDPSTAKTCRGHQLSVTSVAISEDGQLLYTGSKDGSIIKWDPKTMKKLYTFPGGRKGVKAFTGHTDHVLCLAISSDGKYLASGGRDKKVNVWSVKDDKLLCCFSQHKDSVARLVFRKGTNQLYTASHDRTIKLWNVDEQSYIETLFGHQDAITDIDALSREQCVTTGGRDRSARLWKIVEESQLVFRGGAMVKEHDGSGRVRYMEGSLDCVAMIDEENFLSGGDSGSISLWNINRKKPVFTFSLAHGVQEHASESERGIPSPYWITSLTTLRYSDLFCSGSWDGFIRVWKLADRLRGFSPLTQISVVGVVNDLKLLTTNPGNNMLMIAGMGQEHRLGRWLTVKKAKNGSKIFELKLRKAGENGEDAVMPNGKVKVVDDGLKIMRR